MIIRCGGLFITVASAIFCQPGCFKQVPTPLFPVGVLRHSPEYGAMGGGSLLVQFVALLMVLAGVRVPLTVSGGRA